MKIGLLTFHRAENFGAVMQAYALQLYLQNEGHFVNIIDYRCPQIESQYHIYNPSILWQRKNIIISLTKYFERFRTLNERKYRKKLYEEFRQNYLCVSDRCSRIKYNGNYDAYIVGSDQVWNLHITGGVDKNYFLGFEVPNNVIKISYAASAEMDPFNLLDKNRVDINNYLSQFKEISVRETFLKSQIERFSNRKIKVCLDPTFLLHKQSYLDIAHKPQEENYILVYHMTPIPEAIVIAEKEALKAKCNVVEIYGGYSSDRKNKNCKYNLGPLELLGYILNAEKIITSSFHGLALSLILEKNVWVYNKGNNLRQRELLSKLSLEHRLVCSENETLYGDLDYNRINNKLSELIKDSKFYLKQALKK